MLAVCLGMVRSGSTLQYQLVKAVLAAVQQGAALGCYDHEDFRELVRQHGDHPHYYAVKTHRVHPLLPGLLQEGRAVAFYTYRDIRDVVVSYRRMWGAGDLAALATSIIATDRQVRALPRTLITRYKPLVSDGGIENEIRRISEHLSGTVPGLAWRLAPVEVDSIAALYTVDMQQDRIEQLDWDAEAELVGQHRIHPTELLHKEHIGPAKGKPGQWREELTVGEHDAILDVAGDWLIENGYEVT